MFLADNDLERMNHLDSEQGMKQQTTQVVIFCIDLIYIFDKDFIIISVIYQIKKYHIECYKIKLLKWWQN